MPLFTHVFFTSAAVVTGAPQSDNTAVIAGGVDVTAIIIVLILTISLTIIVVVALSEVMLVNTLRLLCSMCTKCTRNRSILSSSVSVVHV